MNVFGGKSRVSGKMSGKKKNVGVLGQYIKPKGSPKVKPVDGCSIVDEWNKDKHVYTMFGQSKECCIKCGQEHSMITAWRAGIASGEVENVGHPYVVAGYWSLEQYKKAMKSGGMLR